MEEFIWAEKYRPHTVAETILPESIKKTFDGFLAQGDVPNLLLSGGSGIGKTTVAKALVEQLDSDYIVINGSLDRNIDTLRVDISNFASSVSFSGGRKYVIIDEADGLNKTSTQKALRTFMDEFSANCGFILTCNYLSGIIDPLKSRLLAIEFKIPKTERPSIAKQFMDRAGEILKAENVEFEPKAVVEIIKKFFPDWRKTLNYLQKESVSGVLDTGALSVFDESEVKKLFGSMKEKNFTEVRKWVAENVDTSSDMYRVLYDVGLHQIDKTSLPRLILILAEYQYKAAFVTDQEINITACMVEIMANCKFV